MIALLETCEEATGVLTPPRLLRSSKYALPSLPSASTRLEGVAPGTSRSTGPEPPRSISPLSRLSQFVGDYAKRGALNLHRRIKPRYRGIHVLRPARVDGACIAI